MFSTFGYKIDPVKHIKILKITYIIYGILLFAFVCYFSFTINKDQGRLANAKNDPSLGEQVDINQMFSMMWKIDFAILSCSIMAICFAFGIKTEKKWATGFLGYILGIIFLLQFPFGTALGIYTLWFLVQYEKSK